jgi:guanylate kinase
MSGTLFVIAAASGAGKTSLVKALIHSLDSIKVSVSHTTRLIRVGEQQGVHYFFISESEFKEMIADRVFLEYAKVYGYFYGTSQAWVEENLRADIDVILEIDWQGARQVSQQFPDCISIFILPPSIQVLEERLLARNQDSRLVIGQRLAAAHNEISHFEEFDYLVINDSFEQALSDLQVIVRARRLQRDVQIKRHAKLLEDLLKN